MVVRLYQEVKFMLVNINKILVTLCFCFILVPQLVLACPADKPYWVEGEEPFFGSYCDLDSDDIEEYSELCEEYCQTQSDRTCKSDGDTDNFEDIFGSYIDVRGKWITDDESEIVTGQSTDRCVTKYTCSCVKGGTPLGSFNTQLVD